MSTEHVDDYDAEYGPTPPGAQYEHTDIDTGVAYKFAIWLTVATVLSAGIVWGTFYFFEGQEQAANTAAQKYPLAAGVAKEPPAPNLQMQPFKDVHGLRLNEAEKLSAYG